MARIFYDTEFLEDGAGIWPISLGFVAESGREYYAVSADMPLGRIMAHGWLPRYVVPQLPLARKNARLLAAHNAYTVLQGAKLQGANVQGAELPSAVRAPSLDGFDIDRSDPRVKPLAQIAEEVREFLLADGTPELWAWYGAYDHVLLAQLFGTMVELPKGIPMWTNDLRQEAYRLGNPPMPKQVSGTHNALEDARHLRVQYNYLTARAL